LDSPSPLLGDDNSFRLLVESVKDYAIIMLDPGGHVASWNEGAENLKGYRAVEIIGRHFSCFYPPDAIQRGFPAQELEAVTRDGRIEDEGWRVRKDGKSFWAHVTISALREKDGTLRGFSKVTGDLTKRRQAEDEVRQLNECLEQRVRERSAQLETANQELEAFSYSVSHDLRAPLRHIGGFANCLAKAPGPDLPEKSRHYLAEILDATRQMGCLIDDLLLFARMGRTEMRLQPVDMPQLVNEARRQLEPEFKDREIKWKQGALLEVHGDCAMLRQVMVNLLSNALKYTRQRKPAEIEIGCDDSSPAETIVFVRDNGVGFDMEYAHKLFGVFQRLHSDEEFEGTGIGLANVRRIIARHRGRTWAEGKINAGATFYFSLPKTPLFTRHL
jgi:PAS domain S-box-containing protein